MCRPREQLGMCWLAVALVTSVAWAGSPGGSYLSYDGPFGSYLTRDMVRSCDTVLDASGFSLMFPSDAGTRITPGRDFYVIGRGPMRGCAVKVELFDASDICVRSVSYNPAYGLTLTGAGMDSVYGLGGGYTVSNICLPDLSFDPAGTGAMTNAACKITLTDDHFAAMILGGSNIVGGLNYTNEYVVLSGTNRLEVTIVTSNGVTNMLTKILDFSVTPDKLMARFSPTKHMDAVTALGIENGWRIYSDPFPGYWSPNSMGLTVDGVIIPSSVFLENLERWRTADAAEYAQGRVHFAVYNVKPSSATECCEMGMMQRSRRIDTDDFHVYRYDIGEPELIWQGVTNAGQFVEMADKLELTHVVAEVDVGSNNFVDISQSIEGIVVTNCSGPISIPCGTKLALFGVAAPLQNEEADILAGGKGYYTMSNHITSVAYSVRNGAVPVYSNSVAVDLWRLMSDGRTNESIYEFKHVLDLSSLPVGEYTISAQAYDAHAILVSNGTESVALTILPPVFTGRPVINAGTGVTLSWIGFMVGLHIWRTESLEIPDWQDMGPAPVGTWTDTNRLEKAFYQLRSE